MTMINLEIEEGLKALRDKYPYEDVQIWVKSSPGHVVLYCAAVGLTTFSSDHDTAHAAVEDVIQRFGDAEYRKQAEIRELRSRLVKLGAVESVEQEDLANIDRTMKAMGFKACGDNEESAPSEGIGHHQPTV